MLETGFAYRNAGARRGLGAACAWVLALALASGAALVPAQAQQLRPEVVDAIRQAAEAASAPAPRFPRPPSAPLSASTLPPPSAVPGSAPSPAPASAPAAAPTWTAVSRSQGHLQAADIGLVINSADPQSVAVGEHYIRRRGLARSQVLRLSLPSTATMTREDFESLKSRIEQRFGSKTQALALAWAQPYAVECNSLAGALALGFDGSLCENSCRPSRVSPYFNSPSAQPFTDHGMRLVMHLAAPSIEAGRELIDRGALADGSLALRQRQPVSALLLLNNGDPARNVRSRLYPPEGPMAGAGVTIRVEPAFVLPAAKRLLMVSTGAVRLDFPGPLDWVPGGLGDHLTSYGGALEPWHGQSTAMEWIASGATASHGTVSEPCNHLQKFPHPQVLLLHYMQGSTAIEAYWKSVAWPQQSMFIGEPLAAPFAVPAWARAAAQPITGPAPAPE